MDNNKKLYSFLELIQDDSEPPKPIVDDGVLLDKSLLIIIGRHKSNKSFLALNMGTAIVSGTDFAGFKIVDKQRVLILSAEGGYYPNRDRIQTIARDIDSEDLENIFFSNKLVPDLSNDDDYSMLKGLIDDLKPKVLILDPFIRFHTVDENSSSKMSAILSKIRALIEDYDIAVILVHHTGKDAFKGGRGSSVIHGEYDSSITIEKRKESHIFRFDMRHVETPEPMTAKFNSETLWFDDPSEDNLIVDYLNSYGPESTSTVMIEYFESNDTCSKSHAYRLIRGAVDSGTVIKDGKILKLPT